MILEKLKQGYRNISDKLFHTKEEYMGIEIIVYVVVEKQPGIKNIVVLVYIKNSRL